MSISELSPLLFVVRCVCMASAFALVGAAALLLSRVPALEAPRFGPRGRRREEARQEVSFRVCEQLLCWGGGLISTLPIQGRRQALERLVIRAGQPMGLCADEWLALSVVSFCVLGLGGGRLTVNAGMGTMWTVGVVALSGVLPLSRLRQAAKERAKQLERSLPTAMDLCVLCMGAGADFPSALKFVVADMGGAHAVCQEELAQVLDEMGLGRTRVEALSALGERTDSVAIRDFVAAVCQSETKGTPLVDALDIQASTLRQRRSVLAEEAAAKAGVRLMLPMMMLVMCVLLIVFGPFIVKGIGM